MAFSGARTVETQGQEIEGLETPTGSKSASHRLGETWEKKTDLETGAAVKTARIPTTIKTMGVNITTMAKP